MASAMITEFGGAVAVPSAVRNNDSTTTIRVNEVIMIRIDGAIDSTVRSAMSWMARSVTPPLPWPRLMLISCASAGSISDPAAISVAKYKTLRGNDADLTKGSLDGPTGTPSRLRDFQSRSWPVAGQSAQSAHSLLARCCAERRDWQEVPVRPVGRQPSVRRRRRPDAGARLPAVAPFQQDSGPLRPEQGRAAGAARRVPVRAPGALSALRSAADERASRFSKSHAKASVRRAIPAEVQGGPLADCRSAPARNRPRDRCAVPKPTWDGGSHRQRTGAPRAAAAPAFAALDDGRKHRTSPFRYPATPAQAAAQALVPVLPSHPVAAIDPARRSRARCWIPPRHRSARRS